MTEEEKKSQEMFEELKETLKRMEKIPIDVMRQLITADRWD